jgi:hypothetical protein
MQLNESPRSGLTASSIAPTRALLVSSSPQVRLSVSRSLVSLGCTIDERVAADAETVGRRYDLCVVDGDDATCMPLLAGLRHVLGAPKVLVLTKEPSSVRLRTLAKELGATNVLARRSAAIDEVDLIAAVQKLMSGELFGLDRHLCSTAVCVHTHSASTPLERAAGYAALCGFLQRIRCQGLCANKILNVCDELMLTILPRADQLSFAYDGRNVAVSVAGRGPLGLDQMFEHAGAHFERRRAAGDDPAPGMRMVLSSVTELVINMVPGEHAEAIALFYVRCGHRELVRSGSSLAIFTRS